MPASVSQYISVGLGPLLANRNTKEIAETNELYQRMTRMGMDQDLAGKIKTACTQRFVCNPVFLHKFIYRAYIRNGVSELDVLTIAEKEPALLKDWPALYAKAIRSRATWDDVLAHLNLG